MFHSGCDENVDKTDVFLQNLASFFVCLFVFCLVGWFCFGVLVWVFLVSELIFLPPILKKPTELKKPDVIEYLTGNSSIPPMKSKIQAANSKLILIFILSVILV